jgi:predicted flap endonuclease-1-like 5' DNA nuclease/glutathione synthase/RimK-type ligase-like ATP-grasp enzyme
MKKIGILFGMEDTFPWAFIDKVNSMNVEGVIAEPVTVDMVKQGEATGYAVIIDRISQDVPFYRSFLKNAAISGTAVINNPFWWSADEKFFNNALAMKVGVPVPKTVLLPSKERPDDTSEKSFRNLKFPISWESIFNHIGFPAYMKPHAGGGWKSVYKVNNPDELFKAYDETEQLVMMLQENVDFEDYYRCYYVGGRVKIMPYEPRNPHHLRYVQDAQPDPQIIATIEDYVVRLCEALGYDFNTVEFAVRDGVPYAIDFCNPAPDADIHSVGQENFDWVVQNAAEFAIERALEQEDEIDNLTWGMFVENGVFGGDMQIEKAEDNPASLITGEILAKLEDELEDAIQEELDKLTEAQIAEVMHPEFVEELAEEAIEEIVDEIEGLFEEEAPETPAAKLADEVMEELELKLQSAIQKEFGKLSENQIKSLLKKDFINELVSEMLDEVEEEIEDWLEKSDKTEQPKKKATKKVASKEVITEEAPDSRTDLFAVIGTASADEKDDLKKIKGVGPKLEKILNEIGIYTYVQVSKMTEREYDLVDSLLTSFKGRGKRDDWAGQAKNL